MDPPKTRLSTRGQPQVQDDTAVTRQTDRESDRRGEVEQPRSAPPQGAEVGGGVGSLAERSEGRLEHMAVIGCTGCNTNCSITVDHTPHK